MLQGPSDQRTFQAAPPSRKRRMGDLPSGSAVRVEVRKSLGQSMLQPIQPQQPCDHRLQDLAQAALETDTSMQSVSTAEPLPSLVDIDDTTDIEDAPAPGVQTLDMPLKQINPSFICRDPEAEIFQGPVSEPPDSPLSLTDGTGTSSTARRRLIIRLKTPPAESGPPADLVH